MLGKTADVCDAFQNHIAHQHAPHTQNQLQVHANFAGTCFISQTNAFSTTRKGNHAHPLLVEPDYQVIPSDKLETHSQKVHSFEFLTEQWENEHDFCYLNQSEYECPSNPKTHGTSDISTYVVSHATKAKFRFPSKDPDENIVIDNRNEAEKVKDILRVWS